MKSRSSAEIIAALTTLIMLIVGSACHSAGVQSGIHLDAVNLPPDTLHRAPSKGLHFGFPYCHAGDIADPEYGNKHDCDEFSPPALKMQAHAATLGMKFYTGNMFPEPFRHQIFVAEHGSWNRSVPVGYRITRIYLEGSRALRYEIFADGWMQGTKAWGRPVDILIAKDGAMLVSDDRAGAIYRISYHP